MNARVVFLMVLAAAAACRAYDPNYCPFETDRQPAGKAVPCEAVYKEDLSEKNFLLFAVSSGTVLVVREKDSGGTFSASLIEKEKVVAGPITLEGNPRLGLRVWTAKLTSEKGPRQDVIICTPSGGNGLGASLDFVCFFLRSEKGYTTVDGLSYNFDANDFVDLNKDGQAEWIQTEFIYGCPGRDGKTHNYWVLNLIQFRDGKPTLANAIDKRFPAWIWFTFKPNHKNTVQLTAAQKQQLFRDQAKGLEIYSPPQNVAAAK